jgi:hypothetical protein
VSLAFFRAWLGEVCKRFIVLWGETQKGGVCVCVCVCVRYSRDCVFVKHQELYGRSYFGRKPIYYAGLVSRISGLLCLKMDKTMYCNLCFDQSGKLAQLLIY